MPDIDIDFQDREQALRPFKYVTASRLENDKLVKHNTGVYFHSVPLDPITGLCDIPYDQAEKQEYFKIDFLNAGLYKGVRDENHLLELMEREPLWDLLKQDDFVNLLFHINGYGNIMRKLEPQSVEQLAAILAMIRPAKKHLLNSDWNTILSEVWTKPDNDEYYFKKSHATAYAVGIVVQMNLICEQISYQYS